MSAAIPAIPEFLRPWLGSGLRGVIIFYTASALLLFGAVFVWQRWGRGPRRRRAYRQARLALQENDWRQARAALRLLQETGRLSASWTARARDLEGECLRLAAETDLAEGRFEAGLEQFRAAAALLNLDERHDHERVIARMLADVRRDFAAGAKVEDILTLIDRTLKLQPRCAEALFWRGLCQVRAGRIDQALSALRESAAASGNDGEASTLSRTPGPARALDPVLYLGALLMRQGQAQEALRHLAEANRLCPESPFVALLLGSAIVASGGDQLALRPLQRALGPQGFEGWNKTHQRAWLEGLPGSGNDKTPTAANASAARPVVSYVRRLAAEQPFHCPVLGDVGALLRQGRFALAQAHYRLGHYAEAADLFGKVLAEGAPTVPVLRGLGLALARLERYDQAFKHLRTAFEQEEPKNHLTAGYLALCGARGKPNRPEDKVNNVAWAIKLLARFSVTGDREWAGLVNGVFAEARASQMPVATEDQQRLCGVLASVEAVDAAAAEAFEELHVSAPQALSAEQAWLYCRAAQVHNAGSARGLDLFVRTCGDDEPARTFFLQRNWNFDDVEYACLERLARWQADAPVSRNGSGGRHAPAFALRPAQVELLLTRSRGAEQAGDLDGAIACVEVLHRLAPQQGAALDRLAQLHYRKGDLQRAAAYLADFEALEPSDHRPLVRRAVIEQQRGNERGCFKAVQQALALTTGTQRSAIAFLGARLALADCVRTGTWQADHPSPRQAIEFLHACLQEEPDHPQALWCLAALRALAGDGEGLSSLAPALSRSEVTEALYHYLGAISNLAAGIPAAAAEAARRAIHLASPAYAVVDETPARVSPLELESSFVLGWALEQQQEAEQAIAPLRQVAGTRRASAEHARLLLGRLHFERGDYAAAVRWWNAVDVHKRAAWQLDDTLRDTVLLAGLLAFHGGRFEQAGDHFREALRLGSRDPRLGPLHTLARIKAAQQLLYTSSTDLLDTRPAENAAWLLKQVVQDGCRDPNVCFLLALAYKRLDNAFETRNALRQITPPDAHVWLQLALLSLQEGRSAASLVQAEEELQHAWRCCAGEAAASHPALTYAIAFNLLRARLALGKTDAASVLIPELLALTADPQEQRSLGLFRTLLQSGQAQNRHGRLVAMLAEMSSGDEQALLDQVRGLGHLDTVDNLLKTLAAARPNSAAIREAHFELTILKAKQLLERGDLPRCERSLAVLTADKGGIASLTRPTQIALYNLLGCCACLCQDFLGGVKYFVKAASLSDNDPRLQQNLALAHEFLGRLTEADPPWQAYLNLLDARVPAPPVRPDGDYHARLAFECLARLAQRHSDKESWALAVSYLQRAHQLRPDDADTLDKLFHLNNQLKRFEDARHVLDYLRHLRSDAPQLDLYELELIEIKNLDDIERLLTEIERVRQKYPHDVAVLERAGNMIANVVAFLTASGKHHRQQLHKTTRSLNRLPGHQVNWPDVHKFLRDMRSALTKLKRAIDRCLPLTVGDSQRRQLQQLEQKIEGDMELCRSLGA